MCPGIPAIPSLNFFAKYLWGVWENAWECGYISTLKGYELWLVTTTVRRLQYHVVQGNRSKIMTKIVFMVRLN